MTRIFSPRHLSTAVGARCGFVFDLDGVIQRGGAILPRAREALSHLYDDKSARWTIPTAFLTNGGGHPESERAQRLSTLLHIPISSSQIILAHSPLRCLRRLVPPEQTALTIGGLGCARALRAYGFSHALDSMELAALDEDIAPFTQRMDVQQICTESKKAFGRSVAMIAIMADSRDWGRDIQILHDTLERDQSRLVVCNGDLLFPTRYVRPRLAGGMFFEAFKAVHAAAGGKPLDEDKMIRLGKPRSANFGAAERALRSMSGKTSLPQRVWMVGDNVASDVRGAVGRGGVWKAVLVRTGNFRDGDAGAELAETVVDDVAEAVEYGLQW